MINRFHDGELDLENVREMIEYFASSDAELVFFSSRPQFYGLDEKLVKVQAFGAGEVEMEDYSAPVNLDFANLSERPELKDYLTSQNVVFVNTREIFCSLTPDCSYVTPQGDYLYVDKDHLSIFGATMYGAAILESWSSSD